MGEIMLEKKVNRASFQIDLRNLLPGIYIIHSEKIKSYKFIKL